MTTSTDKSKEAPKAKTPPKPKGPIRIEAVVPILIIGVISFLFFHFLFDRTVKNSIEWAGTYVHGAEVNVGSFKSSFIQGSFSLKDLQVTDKEMPSRNLLQIGEIKFGFLWDALLRAKFVVHQAGIDSIQIYSQRKKPGFVKPPEPPSNKPSELAKLENTVLDQTQEQFDSNVVGDLAALLDGTDSKDLLKNIQGELKAEARIKALETELKAKEKLWKERIDNLPRKDELDALAKRAKALKFDTKNPKEFAASLKEVDKIRKEADAIIKEVKTTSGGLKDDIEKYNTEIKSLDDLVKQDIKDLEGRLKIPDLDMQDFSKNIFGKMFAAKLVSVQKYMEIGRKYMPPPKDPNAKKAAELIPPARGAGKNYAFRVTTGYPLFWLKQASISSEPSATGFSGKVSGELTNVTSDPKAVGKPAILDVRGEFAKSNIYGAHLKVTIDHIDEPKETAELTVGRFLLGEMSLVSSSALDLGIKKSKGSSNLLVQLQNQTLNVDLKNNFSEVEYDLKAKSKNVQEAFATILNGIPVIALNANATGQWGKIDFHINSNLGKELGQGMKKYVQAKIDEAKRKVRELVDIRIKGEKDKLTAEYSKIKTQVDSVLKNKTDELDKSKSELSSQADSTQKSQKQKAKDELKEKGKKLLKGLKF